MSAALQRVSSDDVAAASRPVNTDSWANLIPIVAFSAVGLSLSYIALTMLGLSASLFNLLGDM